MYCSACWEQREFKLKERELTGNRESCQKLQSLGEGVENDKTSYNQVMQTQFNSKLGINTFGIFDLKEENIGSSLDHWTTRIKVTCVR